MNGLLVREDLVGRFPNGCEGRKVQDEESQLGGRVFGEDAILCLIESVDRLDWISIRVFTINTDLLWDRPASTTRAAYFAMTRALSKPRLPTETPAKFLLSSFTYAENDYH